MEDVVRQDIISLLKRVYNAFEKKDLFQLKILSNYTIHNAGIFQDPDSIKIAIIIYSIGKITHNQKVQEYKGWEAFKESCLKAIKNAIKFLEEKNFEAYEREIKTILKNIGNLEAKFGAYITEVLNQAKIKKGGKIYEHGISAGRVAELLGISPWELMTFVGHTKIMDINPVITKNVKERIKFARKIFGVKK